MNDCPDRAGMRLFLTDQVAEADRLRLEAHLDGGCPNCEALVRELHLEILALASGGTLSLPTPTGTFGDGATEVPPPPAFMAGYEILEELGRGGMGVVYKARQVSLNREVALKMILTGDLAGTEARARFMAEAEVIASIHHPNVVQIHDYGTHAGRPYCALEFCPGGSLATRLRGTPLPPADAARSVEQIAEAVQAAHAKGIIHRDLKPANVLIDEDGSPKVTDFGLARRLESGPGLTQTGAVIGTPSYMPPEQAQGKHDLGPTADVYSLGAVLYECLTGRPPFKAANAFDTIVQVIGNDPVPPTRINPEVPRDLETIALKCLHKDATRRYATASQLAEDLRRFRAGEPIRARPAGAAERAWRWAARRPTAAAFAAFCLLAVVALIGLAVWHERELAEQLAAERQKVRLAERDAADVRRREALTADVRELIDGGQAAFDRADWEAARAAFGAAAAKARPEGGLAALAADAEARAVLAEAARRTRLQVARFRDGSERALAAFTPRFSGQARAADLGEMRAATRAALAELDIDPRTPGPLAVVADRFLEPGEKDQLTAEAYELLVLLAAVEAAGGKPADHATALGVLDRAASLGVRTRAAHLRRARLLGPDEQAAERQRAEDVTPSSAVDHFLLGDDAYNQNNPKEAIGHYDAALRARPRHHAARYFRAVCHLLVASYRAAIDDLTICLGQRPGSVWAHILRGFAHGKLGETTRADEDFALVFASDPDPSTRYAALVNRGAVSLGAGRAAAAAADFRSAVALQPKQYQGHVNLSQALVAVGEAAAALESLDRAIELAPGRADLYRLRAAQKGKTGDRPGALEDVRRAVRLETDGPTRARDRVEAARLLRRAGDREAALTECQASRRDDPRLGAAAALAGEIELELRRYRQAEVAFDDALKLGHPAARLYRARGLARAAAGKHAEAADDYTRALILEPDVGTYVNRGWAYSSLGSPRQALADFDAALREVPGHPSARVGKGLVLIALGKQDEGRSEIDQAVKQAANDPAVIYQAARAYARLGQNDAADRGGRTPALRSAAELLSRALEAMPDGQRGPFWRQTVAPDPALLPLRASPAYVGLDRRYGR